MSIMKKPSRVSLLILKLVSSFWGFEIRLQTRWLCVVTAVIPRCRWRRHRITTNPRIHHSSPNQNQKKKICSYQKFNIWGLWDHLNNRFMNLLGCQLLLDQVFCEGWYWLFFTNFFFFSLCCCNSFLLFVFVFF